MGAAYGRGRVVRRQWRGGTTTVAGAVSVSHCFTRRSAHHGSKRLAVAVAVARLDRGSVRVAERVANVVSGVLEPKRESVGAR